MVSIDGTFSLPSFNKLWISLYFVFCSLFAISQPAVVTHPNDTSICTESSASFRIVAVNTSGYQWQENDGVGWYDLTIDFTYVEGQFTPELSINDANLGLDNYSYRCVVNDPDNARDTSNSALLRVSEPPIITQNPFDEEVCKSDIGIFSVQALNGTNYQWQEFSGFGWIDITENAFYTGSQTPDLEIYTTTGMTGFRYRCIVTHISCPDTSNYGTLVVNQTPIIYSISGGGEYCTGGQGKEILMDGSEIGISYDLILDGESTGYVIDGTGNALSFGLVSSEGNYTVKAYNQVTGCSVNMSSNVSIIKNPLPELFSLEGGGSFCEGSEGESIFLFDSQNNINYELFRNGLSTGISLLGTGFSISFGQHNQAGIYTVIATNIYSGCSSEMLNSVSIIINPKPIAEAGPNQTILSGETTQLSGQAFGGSGNYAFLWSPSYLCQDPQNENTFTQNLSLTTEFSLQVTDNATLCVSEFDDVTIYTSGGDLFASINISSANICLTDIIELEAFVSGGSGEYNYSWTSNPASLISNEQSCSHSPQFNTSYYLEVFDGTLFYYDTIDVQVNPKPEIYNITGGGNYCFGDDGKEIFLDGSQLNTEYKLFNELNEFVNSVDGTGIQINFGKQQREGDYYIVAIDNYSCTQQMNDQVSIVVNQLPIAVAGVDKTIPYGTQISLDGEGIGGSGTYLYSWTPIDSLINPNAQDPLTVPLHTTTIFQLQVTDAQYNCISNNADLEVIFVNGGPLELSILSSLSAVCPGDDFQLFGLATGGSGDYSFNWTSNPSGFSSSIYNPILQQFQTTTYTLTLSDGINIISKDITIESNSLPIAFELSGGGEVCLNDATEDISLNSSEPYTTYQLLYENLPTGISKQGNGFSLNFGNWNEEGNYYVIAENNQTNCSNTMAGTAEIIINDLPLANAGLDRSIPLGSSTYLNGLAIGGTGNYNYTWTPSNLLVNPNAQNTETIILNQTSSFTLKVKDIINSCTSIQDTVMIYIQGGDLNAAISSNYAAVCEGEPVSLLGSASGGNGNYIYSWTSIPEGFYSNIFNPSASPLVNTKYYLDIFDGQNHANDSILISVSSQPLNFNIYGGGDFCEGQNGVNIGLNGSEINTTYTLYQSPEIEINTITGSGNQLNFGVTTNPGEYYIVATRNQACSKPMNDQVEVKQNSLPLPLAGQDLQIDFGGQVTLNGSGSGGSGSYLYTWSPIDSLMDNSIRNPLTIPLHATTAFQLSLTDEISNCQSSTDDQMVVFVSGGPLISQTSVSNNLICPNQEIQLTCLVSGGSGNYTYLWESIPSGFGSDIYNPVVAPTVSSMYYVSISDGSIIITDSVAVNVNPAPQSYQVVGGGEYCANSEGQLIGLNDSEIGVNYELYNSTGFTGTTIAGNNSNLNFGFYTEEGDYYISAVNSLNLCTADMNNSVSIVRNELPIADAGENQSITNGETTELYGDGSGGSGVYLYNWSPDYLLDSPDQQNTNTAELFHSTFFLLNITDNQSGCVSLADTTIVYTTGGVLDLNIYASETNKCLGSSFQLNALVSGGSGNYTYLWSSNHMDFSSTIENPTVNPEISTWYFVNVTDAENSISDSIYITVNNNPNVFQINGGGNFCYGDEGVNISLSGSENQTVYQLYKDATLLINEKLGNGNSLDFGDFVNSGTYTVNAYYLETLCPKDMLGSAVVIQNPTPIADAGPDKFIEEGNHATLNGGAYNGSGSYIYNWSPISKLINPSDQDPSTISLSQSTLFQLKVKDQVSGCESLESGSIVFVGGDLPLTVEIVSSSSSVCPGSKSSLIALPTGGSGNYSYYWESNPSGYISSSNEISINPSTNTWYILTLNDGIETIKDSIAINTLSIPESFTLSGGGGYCPEEEGVNIYLNNSESGVSYALSLNTYPTSIVLAGSGSLLDFGSMLSTGNYSVIAVNQNNCSNLMQNTVEVKQNNKPTRFQLYGGGIYCEGDPKLGILLESSELNVNYELYKDAINTGITRLGNGLPLSFTDFSGNGIFTVTATNLITDCSDNMYGGIPMIINESPNINISGNNEICLEETTILMASGGTNYIWNTYPPQQTAAIEVSPEYDIVYSVISTNNNGCSGMDSIKVSVYHKPQISLENELISYSIIVSPDDLDSYEFYHGENLLQSGASNILFYGELSLDADTIKVVGTNAAGCTDISSLYLEIFEIPNAFSPDGDGKNERFMVGRDISIFSRWGKEIYRGTDGWDGYHKGKLVSPGTYYYVNYIYDTSGDVIKTNKGSVTLVTM